jgi:hypothetical protein
MLQVQFRIGTMMRFIAAVALYMFCVVISLRSPNVLLRALSGLFVVVLTVYFVLLGLSEWGRRAWLRGPANGRQAPEQPAESERGGRESVG